MTRPRIIAHRGTSARAPENTLAAFSLAIDEGAEGIEFDVHLAKDGVPVVIHDDDLRRTGMVPGRIDDITSVELATIDVGSWFNIKHATLANPLFSEQTVPSLIDVLDRLQGYDGLIYVELKCNEWNCVDLLTAVTELIRDFSRHSHIIIKSFKLGAIPEVRHLLPTVKTAALFGPEIMLFLRRREHIIALAREFGADQLSVHYSLVTPRLCKLATEAKMPLTVWTVDDPLWLIRRRNLAVGAVITNDPATLLASV